MAYPGHRQVDVALRDGSTVHVPVQATDAPARARVLRAPVVGVDGAAVREQTAAAAAMRVFLAPSGARASPDRDQGPLIVIVWLAVFALALAGVNELSSRGQPVGFYPSDNEVGEGCG